MLLQDVIDSVGADRFAAACRAARDPEQREWPEDLADVPHDCADLWYAGDAPMHARLAVGLEVYTRMPAYAHLLYVSGVYPSFAPAERETLWRFYRDAAGGDDPFVAEPVLYSLWVDFFEDVDTVAAAWEAMTVDARRAAVRIDRVVDCAGPVPWAMKAPMLDWLANDPGRHRVVHAALAGSAFDVYGKIDVDAARTLHRRLKVDPAWPGAAELASRLR